MRCDYCAYVATSPEALATHRAANHDTSRPPVVRVKFLYATHQRVRIPGHHGTVYTVRQRRYVEREVLGASCEYWVAEEGEAGVFGQWEAEADLVAVEE